MVSISLVRLLIYIDLHAYIYRQRAGVVNGTDLKSVGLCPREFESRRCRFFTFFTFLFVSTSQQDIYIQYMHNSKKTIVVTGQT